MTGRIIRIVLLVVILGIVGYIGLSIYANCAVFRESASGPGIEMPDAHLAPYRVKLVNTGRTLFAAGYSQDGLVYTLHGYWELGDDGFAYRAHNLVLDERSFGAIVVTAR